MTHNVRSYSEIFELLPRCWHNDRVHIVDADGAIEHSYRLEQVWGTNSLAVLRDKDEHKRGYEKWLSALPEIESEFLLVAE